MDWAHPIFWSWLIFAGIMLILELMTGSGFLFWTGLAAAAVSLIVWLVPHLGWVPQVFLFAVFAAVAAYGWWAYLRHHPLVSDQPHLNKRSAQYINRIFTLEKPIVNGWGVIHVDDSSWRVRCAADVLVGARVRVTGVDGVVLLVEVVEKV